MEKPVTPIKTPHIPSGMVQIRGFVLIEVLIGLMLLSMSFMAYTKSISYVVNTTLHLDDEIRATDLSNHLISSLDLYALSLPEDISQLQFANELKAFGSSLEQQLNSGTQKFGFTCRRDAPNSGASKGVIKPMPSSGNLLQPSIQGDLANYQHLKTPQCVTIEIDSEYSAVGNPNVFVHVNVSRIARATAGNEWVDVENRQVLVTKASKTAIKAWY